MGNDVNKMLSGEVSITLPVFRNLPAMTITVGPLKEAESRLIEAKDVTPATYTDLEHCFGEAYRDLKKNLASVMFQKTKVESELKRSEATALLDLYPDFVKDKPKSFDCSKTKEAFLTRDPGVQEAKEALDSLIALEIFLEGKLKVMENVSRYMKKKMDLVIRSGNFDLHVTNKKPW
jgi:hypothetical protein